MSPVTELTPIQGELQAQIMPALWRLGGGTVEQVRAALPPRYRSGYSTVQTVLNRLVDRGLVTRERQGMAFVYRARITEAEYLSRSIEGFLAGTSADVRQAVLAQLISELDTTQLAEVRALARRIGRRRGK